MAKDKLNQVSIANNLEEFAIRYVCQLNSFVTISLMASKIADSGFFYNSRYGRLKCIYCKFELDVSDARYVDDIVRIHRVESHGDADILAEPELRKERHSRTKTESFRTLANHWEVSGEKYDARMVKAYLDSPEAIFLIKKGYSRNSIKVAMIMLLISDKGKDPSNTGELVDALESLCDADVDVLCPEFDKLLYVPPMKVMIQPKSSTSGTSETSGSTSALSGSRKSLSSILKSMPNPFGNSFDLAIKARTDKSKRLKKKKIVKHSIAEETTKKMDYSASGLSLMLAGSEVERL